MAFLLDFSGWAIHSAGEDGPTGHASQYLQMEDFQRTYSLHCVLSLNISVEAHHS